MEENDTDITEVDDTTSKQNSLSPKPVDSESWDLWGSTKQFFSIYHKWITGVAATVMLLVFFGFLNSNTGNEIPTDTNDIKSKSSSASSVGKAPNNEDKTGKLKNNTEQILSFDVTPKQILNDPNSKVRYTGWIVPEGIWFGKIYSISKRGDAWNVYLGVEPSGTDVFVVVENLPSNIHVGNFIEITGVIEDVRSYIVLRDGRVKLANKHNALSKLRPNYNNIICVQKRLKEYGYGVYYIDGIAGTNTKNAVSRFLSKSTVLEELDLSASSQINDVCRALKDVSLVDYKKLVNEKTVASIRKEYTSTYKPIDYEERYYKDLEETDKEKFDKANRFSDLESLYEYLEQPHLKHTLGDANRLRLSTGFLERQAIAQEKLGITFEPRKTDELNEFINDHKPSGVQYEVKVSAGRDKGYYFHNGKSVHGESQCMDMRVLKNCQAGGVCTDKDIKNHYYGYKGQCVNLELEYGLAGIKLDTKRYDDLCERLKNYINKKTGHRAELTISETNQGRNCFMHYACGRAKSTIVRPITFKRLSFGQGKSECHFFLTSPKPLSRHVNFRHLPK